MFFFAICAANQLDLVSQEAKNAGSQEIKMTSSGVEFTGSEEVGYRFCFNSRIASRLLSGLYIDDDIISTDELYEATLDLPWEDVIDPSWSLGVNCTSVNSKWLRSSRFASELVEKGIRERIVNKKHSPLPEKEGMPDVIILVHVEGDTVKWYLDFSGPGLWKRGYRGEQTEAVLKEHLAAALISRSEWKKTLSDENPGVFYDPFCGSGTIAVEAALMATETAPGLLRKEPYAFERFPSFNKEAFEKVVKEAQEKRKKAIDEKDIVIYASDISKLAIEISKAAALKAGVYEFIEFSVLDFLTLDKAPAERGYIVTDPPYGERMKSGTELLYERIGEELQSTFKGWKATILTGNSELLSNIDMKPERTNTLYNGALQCQAAHYSVFTDEEKEAFIERAKKKREERRTAPLSEGATVIYNKLMKNQSHIRPIMEKEGVTSYRLYDADIPEYNAAIDIYEGKWLVIYEYEAPKTIEKETASKRLDELILASERATGIDVENIYVKQRKEMKGKSQYNKLASSKRQYIAKENGVRFYVNFQDYLDTGIFLDHRPVRALIQNMAEGKRFLNLFSYTGTATLNAIKGGAVSTVSVDASNTYLSWLEGNLSLNGYSTTMGNFLYRDDCISWLWSTYDRYDLIFCDPPTFSNSTGRDSFDVQRDQKKLIDAAMMHLAKGGTLIFSTNFRRFKLDESIIEKYSVTDITEKTIGEDFKWTGKKIHQCFLIRHRVKVRLEKPKIKRS